ncbi:hypothetical protein [Streptomyces sp. NPDC060333]|uniref:hypothetical protein n=1 Tax=Streptomyces sp. NPDC060333 TaxID=3347098 RepID=UPI00364D2ABB
MLQRKKDLCRIRSDPSWAGWFDSPALPLAALTRATFSWTIAFSSSPSWRSRSLHVAAPTVSTTLDQPLRERAEAVRQAVLHAARHVLGLALTAVNVEVTDVVLEHSCPPWLERPEPSQR